MWSGAIPYFAAFARTIRIARCASVTADAKIPIMLVEKSTTHWR
jgi:hypothetical protein